MQGGRRRAGGRDSLYGNSNAGMGDGGGGGGGGVYRGALEDELEGTQQVCVCVCVCVCVGVDMCTCT